MMRLRQEIRGPVALAAVASVLYLAAYAAGLILQPGELYLRIQSNIVYNLPALAGLCLAIPRIRRSRGRERAGFVALAGALLAWQGGDGVFSYYDLVQGADAPFPGIADVLYYAGYVLLLVAVPLLVLPARKLHDRRWVLDACILMAVAGALGWEYLLQPIVAQGEQSTFEAAVALGYPLFNVGLLGVLVVALYAAPRPFSPRALVLLAACAVQVVTESIYTYAVTVSEYDNAGNPLELGWLAAYLLIGICFVLPPDRVDVRAERGDAQQTVFGLVMPYVALAPISGLAIAAIVRGEPSVALVFGATAAGVLVFLRQVMTMRENLRLFHDLQHEHRTRAALLQAQSDLGEGMLVVDGQRIITANGAAARMSGYSTIELIDLPSILDLVPAEERQRLTSWLTSRLAGERSALQYECAIARRDGMPIPVEFAVKSLEQNGRSLLLVIFRDVTARHVAEDALRASARTLSATLESTADGIIVVNKEGAALHINSRFMEMWRVPPELVDAGDSYAVRAFAMSQMEDPDAFQRWLLAIMATEDASQDLVRLKDGRVFEHFSRPLAGDGAVAGRVCSFHDISERVRREQVVQASEARFRTLVEAVGSIILAVSVDGRVLEFNAEAERRYGLCRDDAIGRDAIGLLAPAESRAQFQELLVRILEGEVVRGMEVAITGNDGVRRTGLWNFTRFLDADGKPAGAIAAGLDISERIRREEVLQASEARFRTLVESAGSIIIAVSADDRVIEFNAEAERLYGISSDEVIGRDPIELLAPAARRAEFRDYFHRVLDGADVRGAEIQVRDRDGVRRTIHWNITRFLGADGKPAGAIAAGLDISDRKRIEERLRATLAELSASKQQIEEKSALLEVALAGERENARRDPLTNALNHRAIALVIEERVARRRDHALSCAVVMVDVDGMKAVNDTYGHQAGDAVLVAVADALFRDGAVVGRYGGDEFVALLAGVDRAAAEVYCARVSDELARLDLRDGDSGGNIPVKVSLGVAIFPEEAETVAELVGLSDDAMYAAKRQRSASGDQMAGPRPLGDDRAAKMVGELAPLLTSPGDANSKLRLVAQRLSVGAGYDAVDFTLFAPTPGAPLASNAFARVPADVLEAWNRRQAEDDGPDPHPLRTHFAHSPRPVIIEEFSGSELVTPDQRVILAAAGLFSGLVAPLVFEDQVVGMLAVGSKRHGAFTASDAQFVGNVATQVTAIVRMAQLVDELQQATTRLAGAQADTVMMLAAAAEAHDHTTGKHLVSIRVLAEALGRELGYSEPAIVDLGMAAVLHDIGKMSVPESVLSSSGSLGDDEWAVMKRHTLWGAEFLGGKPGFQLAARVARSHHERWDGRGYPDGIAGEAIPEAAQIVTVADSFDAMTHDRPYRAGRTVEEAIAEIIACSGRQFSPRVVDALVRLSERDELSHEHPPEPDELAA